MERKTFTGFYCFECDSKLTQPEIKQALWNGYCLCDKCVTKGDTHGD